MYRCMYVCIDVCMSVCMYVCIDVGMYAWTVYMFYNTIIKMKNLSHISTKIEKT